MTQYKNLEQEYIAKVKKDIYEDLLSFTTDAENLFLMIKEKKKVTSAQKNHEERICEWTAHPSQTWDTLAKQKIREVKTIFYNSYSEDRKNGFLLRTQEVWLNDYAKQYSEDKSQKIIDICNKRLFSLSNAKIPAHSVMTSELLKKVPQFFEVYSRYESLSGWQQEEKAEEKNISFMAFLEEENIPQVYIDERWESIQSAKKMFKVGEEKYYLWIDFDGAKRPDGIMISIFAHMLIDEIDSLGQGISEQQFVLHNSIFTLLEREENRKIVQYFEKVDIAIYALTRQMASHQKFSHNPVCISQMELLKRKRELYLRKIVKIRNTVLSRLKSQNKYPESIFSENVHFIPRFDPFFVTVLRKSNLGNSISALSHKELQAYNTTSRIIDQIILINSLSPDRVCQIILAQAETADDLIVIDNFLKEKIKRWRDQKSQYLAPNPIKNLSLCPLFESEYTATPENISQVLSDLWNEYGGETDDEKKIFQSKFPEMFFAGSDLSKSIGASMAYVQTWKCAIEIYEFNKKKETEIVVKLGSGESYFRQNGFLDPKYEELVWKKELSSDNKKDIVDILGKQYSKYKKSPSGLLSLIKKSPWLNSVTLQSKAREWIFEMSPSQLHNQLKEIYSQKKENKKNILEKITAPCSVMNVFCEAEKATFQSFIGNEKDSTKKNDSYATLVELFAIELSPVLRDRALKRSGGGDKKNGNEVLKKLESSSGINSRAIAGNTASSFLFPLGILGKGAAFEKISQQYSEEEVKNIISFWEPEEFLQVIRQYSAIAHLVFQTLDNSGLSLLSDKLKQEWGKIQKIIPVLVLIVTEKIFGRNLNEISEEKKNIIISLLSDRFRSLLDYDEKNKKFNFSSSSLIFLEKNWEKNAQSIVEKAGKFLSKKDSKYPFSKQDIQQWDRFITMSCRMRGDIGLLG